MPAKISLASLTNAYLDNQIGEDHPAQILFGSASWAEFRKGMISLHDAMPPAKRGPLDFRLNGAEAVEDRHLMPEAVLMKMTSGKMKLYYLDSEGLVRVSEDAR